MGTSNGGRQPDKGEAREAAFPSRPSALPPHIGRHRARRGSWPRSGILTAGFWLLVFLLLASLLKGLYPLELGRLKDKLRASPSRAVPTGTSEKPQPSAPPKAPPPETPVRLTEARAPEADEAPPASTPIEESRREPLQIAELVLSPSPNGNFYAKGEINRQEVVFVIDTGASFVSIPDGLRRKLNLTRGRYLQSATANGVVGMFETRIPSLSLGPLRLKNVPAVLNPNAPDDTVLLGMTALREVRLIHQDGHMVLQQDLALEAAAESSPVPSAPRLKKSVKDCMGAGNVINDRVLKCMQGAEDETEAEPAE